MEEQVNGEVSTSRAWLMAARPHTLPAAASPVVVGVGLAYHDGVFAPVPALLALVGALLLQIGTNLANDYFDAAKGVDDHREEGFVRVTSSGLLAPSQVRNGMITVFLLAVVAGVYLVVIGGLPILVVGLAGILCGITYSGGPVPFGSVGLGDLMVFLFFGVIAVSGTYYVQAVTGTPGSFPVAVPEGTLPWTAIVASLPAACLSTAILVVNNIRDLESDRAAGKRTLAVLIGRRGSRVEYSVLVLVAYAVPVWFALQDGFSLYVLLPLLTIPLAVRVAVTVWAEDTGTELNRALSRTGKLLLFHSLLLAVGMVL